MSQASHDNDLLKEVVLGMADVLEALLGQNYAQRYWDEHIHSVKCSYCHANLYEGSHNERCPVVLQQKLQPLVKALKEQK